MGRRPPSQKTTVSLVNRYPPVPRVPRRSAFFSPSTPKAEKERPGRRLKHTYVVHVKYLLGGSLGSGYATTPDTGTRRTFDSTDSTGLKEFPRPFRDNGPWATGPRVQTFRPVWTRLSELKAATATRRLDFEVNSTPALQVGRLGWAWDPFEHEIADSLQQRQMNSHLEDSAARRRATAVAVFPGSDTIQNLSANRKNAPTPQEY